MRLRNLRKLEEMEIRTENKELARGEGRHREAAAVREGAVEDGRRPDQGGARDVRQEDAARQAPHRFRRGARARRGGDRRGDGGARADHRRGVGEGLDPRAARPSGRHFGHRVQGRRRAEVRLPGGDHVEDPGVRHQRPLLHHRRRRSCRAAAATASRCGSTPTWSRTPSSSRRSATRAGASSWWRARPAAASWWPRTNALANTRKGKQVLNVKPPDKARGDRAGRGRAGRGGRREPQDGDLPARSGAGDGARPRRAAAAPQGRRAVRRDDIQGRRRVELGRRRRPRLQPFVEGARRLARQPRRRRPGAAGPLPRQSEIRPARPEERQERRRRGK